MFCIVSVPLQNKFLILKILLISALSSFFIFWAPYNVILNHNKKNLNMQFFFCYMVSIFILKCTGHTVQYSTVQYSTVQLDLFWDFCVFIVSTSLKETSCVTKGKLNMNCIGFSSVVVLHLFNLASTPDAHSKPSSWLVAQSAAVLWIPIHCIWIRIQNFGTIWIRIQGMLSILRRKKLLQMLIEKNHFLSKKSLF